MGERRAVRAVSVIDIGSNFVRMGVYQARRTGDGDQRVRRIDFLEVPLRLGHEVFAAGRISLQTMRRLSAILRGFSQVMKEYGVKRCYYGHIHGKAACYAVQGMVYGIEFSLIAADYLRFRLKKL